MQNIQLSLAVSDEFLRNVLELADEACSWAEIVEYDLSAEQGRIAKIHMREFGDERLPISEKVLGTEDIQEGIRRILQNDFTSQESHAQLHVTTRASLFEALTVENGGDPGYVDLNDIDWIVQAAYFGHMVYG